MHYHTDYEKYLKDNTDELCYDGQIYELDVEDYIELNAKQYRINHPDKSWYRKFENKKKKKK